MDDAFRALKTFNYRIWAGGALTSNIGTWMQRTAQDWLVLTQLSHHNATAVGVVMALQYAPLLFLLPVTGFAADRFNRRKLLIVTQASMGLLAFALGGLIISGYVQLWHVYVFAFLLGCVTAFDTPARQTFVSELVAEGDISNAVALNSTSFNAARMIGPAIAGILIAQIGCGWLFIMNGVSFAAVIASLLFLRVGQLRASERAKAGSAGIGEGFRYAWGKPDIKSILIMIFLIGTFGINFPIFISTMSVTVFHGGSSLYGFLTSMMAIGSVIGAFLSARRAKPGVSMLLIGAFTFGLGFVLAMFSPGYLLFGFALMLIGAASQTFTTTANSTVQLATEPAMRGRVMALFFAIAMGATPVGAPFVGNIADKFGPRAALAVGAASGFFAFLVGVYYLLKYQYREPIYRTVNANGESSTDRLPVGTTSSIR